jgi:hypothetical protein
VDVCTPGTWRRRFVSEILDAVQLHELILIQLVRTPSLGVKMTHDSGEDLADSPNLVMNGHILLALGSTNISTNFFVDDLHKLDDIIAQLDEFGVLEDTQKTL